MYLLRCPMILCYNLVDGNIVTPSTNEKRGILC
nr:MAG TPA: hypothetical protein [Caudoviricetes sp.]